MSFMKNSPLPDELKLKTEDFTSGVKQGCKKVTVCHWSVNLTSTL